MIAVHVVSAQSDKKLSTEPDTIEKMVGPCGLEPQTSTVSR